MISNSWGEDVPSNTMEYAIDSAITLGRNGKGCVLVFAAGNENTSVSYPATNNNVIAVGAITNCGERKSPTSCDGDNRWGSNYGNELDVMAPGVFIATTDRQGAGGYNNGQTSNVPQQIGMPVVDEIGDIDYTLAFGHTSAACPHVSGIAALMLSVNPDLTAAKVARIIKGSAQKVGNYIYAYDTSHLFGSWHQEMGYGLVDAGAAVAAAASDTAELYIRDNAADVGAEPYITSNAVNFSPDIRIKTLSGSEVVTPLGGSTYNVDVTIRNLSNSTIIFNQDKLQIHWAAGNNNPVWKNSWMSPGTLCGVALGGTINAIPGKYPTIPVGGSCTITRKWVAPSIGGCLGPYYATPLHIVALVDDGGLTIGENETHFPLDQFVKTNNNVAWHQYTLSYDITIPIITSISPNPTSGQTTVSYRLGDTPRSGASLAVVTATGNRVLSVPIGDAEGSVTLNLQSLVSGHYVVQLISSGEVLDAKPLVVE